MARRGPSEKRWSLSEDRYSQVITAQPSTKSLPRPFLDISEIGSCACVYAVPVTVCPLNASHRLLCHSDCLHFLFISGNSGTDGDGGGGVRIPPLTVVQLKASSRAQSMSSLCLLYTTVINGAGLTEAGTLHTPAVQNHFKNRTVAHQTAPPPPEMWLISYPILTPSQPVNMWHVCQKVPHWYFHLDQGSGVILIWKRITVCGVEFIDAPHFGPKTC